MPVGGGKFGPEATAVLKETKAEAVVLIVLGGEKGSGFSVIASAATPLTPPVIIAMLRKMADDMSEGVLD